jgi:hypothetical protein
MTNHFQGWQKILWEFFFYGFSGLFPNMMNLLDLPAFISFCFQRILKGVAGIIGNCSKKQSHEQGRNLRSESATKGDVKDHTLFVALLLRGSRNFSHFPKFIPNKISIKTHQKKFFKFQQKKKTPNEKFFPRMIQKQK